MTIYSVWNMMRRQINKSGSFCKVIIRSSWVSKALRLACNHPCARVRWLPRLVLVWAPRLWKRDRKIHHPRRTTSRRSPCLGRHQEYLFSWTLFHTCVPQRCFHDATGRSRKSQSRNRSRKKHCSLKTSAMWSLQFSVRVLYERQQWSPSSAIHPWMVCWKSLSWISNWFRKGMRVYSHLKRQFLWTNYRDPSWTHGYQDRNLASWGWTSLCFVYPLLWFPRLLHCLRIACPRDLSGFWSSACQIDLAWTCRIRLIGLRCCPSLFCSLTKLRTFAAVKPS